MVWLMRKNKCTTLAIGDGANDVNMINTAHVGVGIKGVEGAQAALCSDYAISQFQILRELILYHGRESYRKNSQLILFNFYKNLLLVLPQLWYGFINHFSSAMIYDPWIYQLYNVVFTSLPIIAYAIYDQEYSVRQTLADPQLYSVGLKNELFNINSVVSSFSSSAFYALLLVVINFYAMQWTIDGTGYMFDLVSSGMSIFAQCIIISNVRILILSYKLSFGTALLIVLSILMFYISVFLGEHIFRYGQMGNIVEIQIRSFSYWSCVISSVGIVACFEAFKKRDLRMKQLQKRVNVEFVEREVELPLMKGRAG